MAISLLEQRLACLSERSSAFRPFGPMGLPPSFEDFEEEYMPNGVALVGKSFRRSHSWAGYASRLSQRQAGGIPKTLPTKEVMSKAKTLGAGLQEEAAEVTAAGPDDQGHITTLVVKKLPRNLTRHAFTAELDALNFAGQYDYVHLPKTFGTGKNQGFAFVNFTSAEAAESFAALFAESSGGLPRSHGAGWRVGPAEIQGFEANARLAQSGKKMRIRSKASRPLLLQAGEAALALQ